MFFFALYDQLKPRSDIMDKYYMVCVPCCCGCFCTDNWLKCLVPKCCINRKDVKLATWIIIGMSFVWIVCTVVENNNECLAEASLIEYAFGFRGASILVLLFSVFINIELTYSGEVKHRERIFTRNENNNNNNGVGLVVAPVQAIVANDDNDGDDVQIDTNNNDDNDDENDGDEQEEELAVR